MAHRWHFFRAGGVDQVSLRDGDDVLALGELDQKLWVALAMPVSGTSLDPETLKLIDREGDGRIRVQDILELVRWIQTTFKNPNDILQSANDLALSAIADPKVVAAAKHMLKDLGKSSATSISVEDASAMTKAFADTVLNGDGIVIPASTDDPRLKKAIEEALASVGSVVDRSGKPGIDKPKADEFFAAVDLRAAWQLKGTHGAFRPLGAKTAAASAALAAVREKLEDYFTRCHIAAFDARGAATLGGSEAELGALATRSLTTGDDELAKLPLAKIEPTGRLVLTSGVNPAWSARVAAFLESAVTPILGARDSLSATDLASIVDVLAPYDAWLRDEPKTVVDSLESLRIAELANKETREALDALIASDAVLAAEYDQISSVVKAVRIQRDGGRLLRNFVNFSDFYGQQDGVFQAGTLYLDARALRLCVSVGDVAAHSALAGASDANLLYCDIRRNGATKQIAAALTNGDADNIFVGRNGVFYDRDGADWDATITKIISNPISIRAAFWSPYKKLVQVIEDTVAKRAAAADADASARATGTAVGTTGATTPEPPAESKKLDLGTVAAIGLAIGGVGTLVGALLGTMFGLGKWLPLGLLALLLLISGPAMLLAWLKLRRRNLGPILDANGWAINGRTKINVAFGAAMTQLAKLPKGSTRSTDDPFADKKTPWKRWFLLALLLVLGGSWYLGTLDAYLPTSISSVQVLGERAPAAKKAP